MGSRGVSLSFFRVQAGDSTYDLPYSFAYVIDVAIKGSDDTDYSQYSTILDTGSSNLGKNDRRPSTLRSRVVKSSSKASSLYRALVGPGVAEESCSACGGSDTSSLDMDYSSTECIEVRTVFRLLGNETLQRACSLWLNMMAFPIPSYLCGLQVVYGDSKEDSTYWSGYESVTCDVGFVSGEVAALCPAVASDRCIAVVPHHLARSLRNLLCCVCVQMPAR